MSADAGKLHREGRRAVVRYPLGNDHRRMVATDIINANEPRVRIAAIKTGAPLDHVNATVRSDLHINRPIEREAGKERVDFEHAAVVINFYFLDVVARPFPN